MTCNVLKTMSPYPPSQTPTNQPINPPTYEPITYLQQPIYKQNNLSTKLPTNLIPTYIHRPTSQATYPPIHPFIHLPSILSAQKIRLA